MPVPEVKPGVSHTKPAGQREQIVVSDKPVVLEKVPTGQKLFPPFSQKAPSTQVIGLTELVRKPAEQSVSDKFVSQMLPDGHATQSTPFSE